MNNKIGLLSLALVFLLLAICSVEQRPLSRIAFDDVLRDSPISSEDGRYMAGFVNHPSVIGAQIFGPGGFSTQIDAIGGVDSALFWRWSDDGQLWVYDRTLRTMRIWSKEGASFSAVEWPIQPERPSWRRALCERSLEVLPPEALLPMVWSVEDEAAYKEETGVVCAPRLW